MGWSGGAKVSCFLRHRGVQLILAYSWARPAILVAGKGRGGMLLFLLFLHFHSYSSFFSVPLFHLFYYFFYLFSPFLWETTQNDPQVLTCCLTPTQLINTHWNGVIRYMNCNPTCGIYAEAYASIRYTCWNGVIRCWHCNQAWHTWWNRVIRYMNCNSTLGICAETALYGIWIVI